MKTLTSWSRRQMWLTLVLLGGVLVVILVWRPWKAGVEFDRVYRMGYGRDVPFHFKGADGSPSGLAVELVREAAARRRIQLEWVEGDGMVAAKTDLWVLMTIRPERLKTLHITDPFLQSHTCFVVPRESHAQEVKDLHGARISFLDFAVHRLNLSNSVPRMRPIPVASSYDALREVAAGRADAAYLDEYAALPALLTGGFSAPLRLIPSHLPRARMGIGSTFAAAAVADEIRDEVRKMAEDGTLQPVTERWGFFPNLTTDMIEGTASAQKWAMRLGVGVVTLAVILALAAWLAFRLFRQAHQLKKAQAELTASEERFRTLVEQASDGFEVLDEEGRYVDANSASCRQLGYSKKELLGMSLSQIDPLVTHAKYRETFKLLRGKGALSFESIHRRKDGSEFPVEVSVSVVELRDACWSLALVRDITQRKRTEDALRNLATSFAHLSGRPFFEAVSHHLASALDVGFVFVGKLDSSQRAVTVLGGWAQGGPMGPLTYGLADTPCDNVMGKQACLYPSAVQTQFPKDSLLVQMGIESYCGSPVFDKQGQALGILVALHTRPLSSPQVISQLFSTYLDRISAEMQRVEAEEELKRSEVRFRRLFDGAADAVFVHDREGQIMDVNQVACEKLGYTREELLRMSVSEVEVALRPEELAPVWDTIRSGKSFTVEGVHRRRDGSTYHAEIHIAALATGDRPLFFAAARDITQRRRAEESQSRLATAVEQAAEAILITDTQGAILYANPAFERSSGFSRAEALGQNPRILKSGKHDAEFYRRMWEVLLRGEVWQGHLINRRKDGTTYEEETTISPVRDAAGAIINYVAVKHDVTREVRLESQLRQAQKMEAVGQLAGGVAHDFNNILAATMMNLGLLQGNPNLDQETRDGLNELAAGAKRAAELTRQLLMFSRRSVLNIQTVDLNELVADMLKLLGRLLGEPITLVLERSNNVGLVEADAGMLEQVVMNLTVNARDAMPKGGRITLSTAPAEFGPVSTEANPSRRQGSFVCLTVSDTGCGMDEATLRRAFEPFFTTKEPGKGTGLGLATVHGIVAQHKGWVEVDSQVGQGTCFRVYLPSSSRRMPLEVSPAQEVAPTGHEALLVVEDEANVRRALVQTLRRLGYRVWEAANGQEAMVVWREHLSEVALLFTDMVMPEGMSGLELAAKLREEKPDLKVIISTGYSAEVGERGRLAAMGVVYLPKPYRPPLLAKTVRECLDRKCTAP